MRDRLDIDSNKGRNERIGKARGDPKSVSAEFQRSAPNRELSPLVTFRQFRVSGLVSPVKKSKHAFPNSEPETQNSEQFSNPQPRRNLSGLQANFAAARRCGKELRRI